MASRHGYLEFLGSFGPFSNLRQSDLRAVARVIDDVRLATGTTVRVSRRELVIVAGGSLVGAQGAVLAPGAVLTDEVITLLSDARLLVLGRRELAALIDTVPCLGAALPAACRSVDRSLHALDDHRFGFSRPSAMYLDRESEDLWSVAVDDPG